MSTGSLELTAGLAAAGVPSNAWIDAAISGDIAGIELELGEPLHVHIGQPADRRARLMLDISTDRATLTRLRDKLTEVLA